MLPGKDAAARRHGSAKVRAHWPEGGGLALKVRNTVGRVVPHRRVTPPKGRGLIVPLLHPVFRRRGGMQGAYERGEQFEIQSGDLVVRLAQSPAEVEASQLLRYRIFYEAMSARPSPEVAAAERDFDRFDPFCDHLLVFDTRLGHGPEAVVGTYRLMRRDAAARIGRFYTQDEYNIRKLLRGGHQIMELGRSCIHPDYRRHQTMQMLWRGIAQYIFLHDVKLMFGCASFPGTDPDAHAEPLSLLHYEHLAPTALRPKALRSRYVEMRRMDRGSIDARRALAALPPLLKGYLRVGGAVGEGAVIDEDFNTVDVCIVVRTDHVTSRYVRRYSRDRGPAEGKGSPQ